jgi:hypothetical protein
VGVSAQTNKPTTTWVQYSPLTATYDTPDGAVVSAELVDNVTCLADVMRIAAIRAKQREAQHGRGEDR